MRKSTTVFTILSFLLLITYYLLLAQTEYPRVMDNGGGHSESSNYKNLASIGQAVIGIATSTNNTNQAGYITAVDTYLEIKEDPLAQEVPTKISIGKPYPNPFNIACQVKVEVPEPSQITFQVYDLMGREILSEQKNCKGGTYWLLFNAEGMPSGVYLYKISVGKTISDGKFMLVK